MIIIPRIFSILLFSVFLTSCVSSTGTKAKCPEMGQAQVTAGTSQELQAASFIPLSNLSSGPSYRVIRVQATTATSPEKPEPFFDSPATTDIIIDGFLDSRSELSVDVGRTRCCPCGRCNSSRCKMCCDRCMPVYFNKFDPLKGVAIFNNQESFLWWNWKGDDFIEVPIKDPMMYKGIASGTEGMLSRPPAP